MRWGIAPVARVGFLFLAFPDRRSASKANLASKGKIWSVPIENPTEIRARGGVHGASVVAKFGTTPYPTIVGRGRVAFLTRSGFKD